MSQWVKYRWYIILGVVAIIVFASMYWYATRAIKTDVPDDRAASIKSGVAYNPNKDLWLTRATDVAVAVKQVESSDDCRRLVAGICGDFPPVGYSDERTWYDACTCEVVGKICYPAWDKKRSSIESKKSEGIFRDAWHVLERRPKVLAAGGKDVLPWNQ